MFLIFDTETHDGPPNRHTFRPVWPRMVSIAWRRHDKNGRCRQRASSLVIPEGFQIQRGAQAKHGISTARAMAEGRPLVEALTSFSEACQKATVIVAHNIEFDANVIRGEFRRHGLANPLAGKQLICTMKGTTRLCRIPSPLGYRDFKWPSLAELYRHLFDENLTGAHDADADTAHCAECFFELLKLGWFTIPAHKRSAA